MTSSTFTGTSAQIIEQARKLTETMLADALEENGALQIGIVSTVDGRVLSMRTRDPRNGDRLGAVFSSLLAISETACRELAFGRVRQVLLSTEGHNIFVIRVGTGTSPFVLATAYSGSLLLGSALHSTQSISVTLAKQLGKLFANVLPSS